MRFKVRKLKIKDDDYSGTESDESNMYNYGRHLDRRRDIDDPAVTVEDGLNQQTEEIDMARLPMRGASMNNQDFQSHRSVMTDAQTIDGTTIQSQHLGDESAYFSRLRF